VLEAGDWTCEYNIPTIINLTHQLVGYLASSTPAGTTAVRHAESGSEERRRRRRTTTTTTPSHRNGRRVLRYSNSHRARFDRGAIQGEYLASTSEQYGRIQAAVCSLISS